MGFLDARVDHLNYYLGVVGKVDHQLLGLLHVAERVFINDVSVVEEQIVFRSYLHFDVLYGASFALQVKHGISQKDLESLTS